MISEPMEKIQGRIVNLGPCEICGKPVQVSAAVHKLYKDITTCSRKCGEQLAQRQTEQKESESVGKHREDKEALIAKVRDEIAKGRTAQAVGKELGLAKSTLHNWLHTEPKEVARPTNEQLRLDYYECKGSKSALMRQYHVGWYTVEKWCKEAGIDMAKKPKAEKDDKPIRSMGCIEPVAIPLGVEVPKDDRVWKFEDEEPIPYSVNYIAEHHKVAEEMACLLDSKRHDYGTENIKKFGTKGIMVRVSDKIERLINLTWGQDGQPNHESIEDTWRDIAGYGLLALIELRAGR